MAVPLLLLLALTSPTLALVGYDCSGHKLNITSLSLIDIGECNMDNIEAETKTVFAQLLQLSDYDETDVIQCRIEVDRTIYYCGMHSHISIVYNGKSEYIWETSQQVCKRIHETGNLDFGKNNFIVGLRSNSTSTRSVTLAGQISTDGKCSGTQYSDPYGTWENVVVQASIKITLKDFRASIKRTSSEIILPSGVHCQVQNGHCKDTGGDDTYWNSVPTDNCHFSNYDVLYEGKISKLTSKNQQTPIVYTITTQETTFALTKTIETKLCGYTLSRTEHPKLFILETRRGNGFQKRANIMVNNLDIFTYVNSKFLYVEKHVKIQLNQLYKDLMQQKCALEKQVLLNALSLYSIAPDEMAYRIMKAPGYTAIAAGEVIHLIKCIPVECKIRPTDICYNELPVLHGNRSVFLLPGSRIITRKATIRECNALIPPMYKIHNTWYRLTPKPLESLDPPIIKPLTKPTWKYVSPANLATSGLYSMEDLERLRNHIMFPVEKPSILDSLARGASGHMLPPGSLQITKLFDEEAMHEITRSVGAKIWQNLITFGSASAGILAIFMIIRFIKLIFDTVIHGYALHAAYGWSIHLLGAIWSSVTHLLLHRQPTKEPRTKDKEDKAIHEDQPIASSSPEELEERSSFIDHVQGRDTKFNVIAYKSLRDRLYEGK